MDKDELKKKTVAQLREEAKTIPGVKGLSSMKKDELVDLIAGSSGEKPAAPKASKPAGKKKSGGRKGLNKSDIKKRIRTLKEEKREALARQDYGKAKECNRQIHSFKHQLRRMASGKTKIGK